MHRLKQLFQATLILLIMLSVFRAQESGAGDNNCLFRNPLCFYTNDILTFLQALHKQQMYAQMGQYLYGPEVDGETASELTGKLAAANFGYGFKRVGIREIAPGEWSLTFRRTILGTEETFTIDCKLIGNTCKMYLDAEKWKTVFPQKIKL